MPSYHWFRDENFVGEPCVYESEDGLLRRVASCKTSDDARMIGDALNSMVTVDTTEGTDESYVTDATPPVDHTVVQCNYDNGKHRCAGFLPEYHNGEHICRCGQAF